MGGDDDLRPAVGLLRRAGLRGGEAGGALQGADRVLDVEAGQVGAPELVEGQRAGAGVPEPHGAVRVAAVGQALDGDVDEGAAQDRELVPAGEPAAVAVDLGVDVVPGLGPDGAVERGVREDEGLVRLRGRGKRLLAAPRAASLRGGFQLCLLQAVDLRPPVRGPAVLPRPGGRVLVEDAAGGQAHQDVRRAAGQSVGERGGAVAGVEDEQRRRPAGVPSGAKAAQHALDLVDRLGGAGGRHGAPDIGERGPRGPQVPGDGGELVLPAGRGLAGPLAVTGPVVDVLAARRAPGGVRRRHPGQRPVQHPVVDGIVLRDPGPGFRAVHQRRQHRREQGEQPLVIDAPGGQGIVERAVAAAELRLQGQLHQRPHRAVRAQDGVRQLEQRVASRRQAPRQLLPELPQRAERRVPRKGWQPGTRAWQGRPHGRFLSLRMNRSTKSDGNGRPAHSSQIYKRMTPISDDISRI